nr:hypothetical protein [Tanacetum cinerariifolium]
MRRVGKGFSGVETPLFEDMLAVVPPTPTSPSPSSPVIPSSKLRRLKKVGTSQHVESSDDVENVFNRGRIIVDMDQDEGIELVTAQENDAEVEGRHADKQAEIYNIDLDHSLK